MFSIALKGLLARRKRALGIGLAVFLGVSLVAGTLVFTDTINRSFDELFEQTLQGTDVVVSSSEVVRQDAEEPPPFAAKLLERVRAVDGVEAADGSVGALARVTDVEGEPIGNEFAPSFVFSAGQERFNPVTFSDGRNPRGGGEAAIDETTAQRGGVAIGDRIGIAGDRALRRFEVVGLFTLGEASTGGSSTAVLSLEAARAVTDREGQLDQISIAAADGVDPLELRAAVRDALPRSVRVETASQSADRQTAQIDDDFLGALRTILLVFGGVVVVVAAFLIFNTFSITVAQRIREFGLLRTLGASRRQVLRTVLAEAAAIGLLASLAGLAGGIAAAIGLRAMFDAIGVDLPSSGTAFELRTVVVALVLGLVMTVLSSLAPALRATRVTPMAALLEAELPERRGRGRIRALFTALLAIIGLALLLTGLFADVGSSSTATVLMGTGATAILFAVSLYTPQLVGPIASLIGRPLERLRGVPGRLARENAVRKPGRTAVTAAALMIGLALVTFVTVFASGISSSIEDAVRKGVRADVIIQNQDGFSPFAAAASREVAGVEGVERVSRASATRIELRGIAGDVRASGVEPASVLGALELDWEEGSDATMRGLTDGETVVEDAWAKENGVALGDRLDALGKNGRRLELEVVGRFTQEAGALGSVLATRTALERSFGEKRDSIAFATLAAGAGSETVARVQKLVEERYPAAEALDQEELIDNQQAQIQPIIGLFYALLALAVMVSLFGVANTLSLSIHERTRELGLLRAVGMSKRQVRQMIRYESVITALIGAILGLILGVLFAALVSRPLADEGFALSYPILVLVLLLVAAALAGVLAAVLPNRRATRLKVLEAVSYE
jgi:putative ABC transport system permease protein